jgi:hypothetical protein
MKNPIADSPSSQDPTEALLQDLIGECRDMIRAMVLPSAQATDDDDARHRYLNCAMALARTGATVGDTIARLRGGLTMEQRQRIIVERVQSLSTTQGRGDG